MGHVVLGATVPLGCDKVSTMSTNLCLRQSIHGRPVKGTGMLPGPAGDGEGYGKPISYKVWPRHMQAVGGCCHDLVRNGRDLLIAHGGYSQPRMGPYATAGPARPLRNQLLGADIGAPTQILVVMSHYGKIDTSSPRR